MANTENQKEQFFLFDLANKPVIADAVFPEFSELGTMQRLADAARIV